MEFGIYFIIQCSFFGCNTLIKFNLHLLKQNANVILCFTKRYLWLKLANVEVSESMIMHKLK